MTITSLTNEGTSGSENNHPIILGENRMVQPQLEDRRMRRKKGGGEGEGGEMMDSQRGERGWWRRRRRRKREGGKGYFPKKVVPVVKTYFETCKVCP